MGKKRVLRLSLLLLLLFSGAVLALRLPASGSQSVRTGRGDAEQPLTGGDAAERAALELLPGELLDLNAAGAEELQKLPGIGPALSEAIVSYRAEHGPFGSVEELMNVPGIGPARYAAVADSITVEETP